MLALLLLLATFASAPQVGPCSEPEPPGCTGTAQTSAPTTGLIPTVSVTVTYSCGSADVGTSKRVLTTSSEPVCTPCHPNCRKLCAVPADGAKWGEVTDCSQIVTTVGICCT